MQLLRAATLVTADPDATAARYAEWFGYRLVERGSVPRERATAWGALGSAGRCYCVCAPASGAKVYLRFIEGETPDDYQPLRSHGWAAIEICVRDVLAVQRRLAGSSFEIIGPAKALDGLPMITAMQVRGPDSEVVFLTQVDADLPGMDLPRAACPVDRLFIVVLACADLHASRAWFAERLQFDPSAAMAVEYGVLSDAFGLPATQKHDIATVVHGRDVFLELDQYPSAAVARTRPTGALPPGIAMATFLSPDFARLDGAWIAPPTAAAGVIYAGRISGTMVDPDGSLVEVVAI